MTSSRTQGPSTRISLLLQIRESDNAQAWQAFVSLYTPLIHSFARARGFQDHDCLDIAQDTLLEVSRSICDFEVDPSKGRFRSWLGTLTYRTLIRFSQRNRRRIEVAGDVVAPQIMQRIPDDYESEWAQHFTEFVYRTALQKVREETSAERWEAFELAWLQDCPARDVAAKLNRPVGWVYQVKFQLGRQLELEIRFLSADDPFLA